jgi:hypothetical protein
MVLANVSAAPLCSNVIFERLPGDSLELNHELYSWLALVRC